MQPVLDRVRSGEEDPPCERCGGILKSATISFGQSLVPNVIERAMRAAEESDLLLAIGIESAGLSGCGHRPAREGRRRALVIVNAEPTPFDDLADVVLREPIGRVLPSICADASIGKPPSASDTGERWHDWQAAGPPHQPRAGRHRSDVPEAVPVRSARVRPEHRPRVRRHRSLPRRAAARVSAESSRLRQAGPGRGAGKIPQGAVDQAGVWSFRRPGAAHERRRRLEAAAQTDTARLSSRVSS